MTLSDPTWRARRQRLQAGVDSLRADTSAARRFDEDAMSAFVGDIDRLFEELQAADEELRAQQVELLAANEALGAERRRYRDLFDWAPDGYVVLDLEGNITEANQAAAALLGGTCETLVDARLGFFLPIELRRSTTDLLQATTRDGEERTFDAILTSSAHRETPVQVKTSAIRDGSGAAVGLRCLIRDVTAHQLQEAQLRQSLDAARAAQEAKSRFLANMSHEIRTPMNGVMGVASLLLESPLTPEQRELVDIINESGESLLHIIDEILDLARIEAGRVTIESLPFDLRETMDEVRRHLQGRATAKGLKLEMRCAENLPERFIGDRGRIRQVIVNLVGNALKFTEQGKISIMVEVVSARASGNALPAGGESPTRTVVSFSVTDTGIGVPEAVRSSIWEEFNQGDSSTTRRFGGTGLGLSISRQLVQAMGGSIGFESQVGQGSTFHFSIPLESCADPDTDPDPETSPAEPSALRRTAGSS